MAWSTDISGLIWPRRWQVFTDTAVLSDRNIHEIEVSLEVNAKAPDGLSHPTVRTIAENCRTLKVQDFGFDD